jgi:hypothetical protein
MRSTADSADSSRLQEIQGTTEGKQLTPEDLLALRAMFLLLDEWDRSADRSDTRSLRTRITPISQLACQAQRQDNAAPSPQRQDHLTDEGRVICRRRQKVEVPAENKRKLDERSQVSAFVLCEQMAGRSW